jgi:DNA-binding response OmpR family regulator
MQAPSVTDTYVLAVVEDDEDLRQNTAQFLVSQGFTVWTADSAESFYRQMVITPTDLVIVDLGLPGEDGLSLVSHLHAYGKHAVIILTARGESADRVKGLETGADYYFVKPVDLFELAAGIRAVMRKRQAVLAPCSAPEGVTDRAWGLLRAEAVLAAPNGVFVHLTSNEIILLNALMQQADKVLIKAQLYELFEQAPDDGDFHRIEVIISRLRMKVLHTCQLRLPVRAVFGRGLVFVGACMVKP